MPHSRGVHIFNRGLNACMNVGSPRRYTPRGARLQAVGSQATYVEASYVRAMYDRATSSAMRTSACTPLRRTKTGSAAGMPDGENRGNCVYARRLCCFVAGRGVETRADRESRIRLGARAPAPRAMRTRPLPKWPGGKPSCYIISTIYMYIIV